MDNTVINAFRARLRRKIQTDRLIVLAVCIVLALYGQDIIRLVMHPYSVMCGRHAWLFDWMLGLGGDVVIWQLNNCV